MDNQNVVTIIEGADAVIAPFIKSLNPAIGVGVDLGLQLLAAAEPAVYNAIVVALQGGSLTAQQIADKDAAVTRLQNPASYFS